MIKEQFLYFIWERQLFNHSFLKSTDNEIIEIIEKGTFNDHDGPDILEAKIKVDQTILVGSIEFHVNTSDWVKHKHHLDSNYNNVILHVVWRNDINIPSLKCPTLSLQGSVPKYYYDNYQKLTESSKKLPCSHAINQLDDKWLIEYRKEILRIRIDLKIKEVLNDFTNIKLDKIYQVFMSVLGSPQNAYGFNKLSKILPYQILNKYKNDKHRLEAILFGVSGLLHEQKIDRGDYISQLKQTYLYFNTLHSFTEMSKSDWIFLRVRPSSFPTVRLSLLADLFCKINSIEDFILNESFDSISKTLNELESTTYWNTHYVFNKPSKYSKKSIGKLTILKLWINAIIPLRILYSENKKKAVENSLLFLESKPSEPNKVNRLMRSNGFQCDNALQSQFNLHKYKYYCIPRKCLNCGIGYKIIRSYD